MRAAPATRRTLARYRFIGGKGGVGKTTCAAALAIESAARGARTLVVSTDPAPSLGDALGVRLSRRPRRVSVRRGTFHAVEVDAATVIRDWISTRSGMLQDIALRGTWLDAVDVGEIIGLSLPGIDELAGLLELVRFGRSGRYDLIVVDTAPTGHTLRMLAMPDTLGRVASVFDAMQEKHRAIVAALRGRWIPDAADSFVQALDDEARELSALLRDPDRTGVTWVSLPERLAIEETLDALRALALERLPVDAIILNRLTPGDRPGCRFCAARRRLQQAATFMLVSQLANAVGRSVPVTAVPDRSSEPTGMRALTSLSRQITAGAGIASVRRNSQPARVVSVRRVGSGPAKAGLARPDSMGFGKAALIFFGGKGGVGKTTCAAAMALGLASAFPAKRILLLSADPAHSLGDVLRMQVSNEPRRIAGGPKTLAARELDAGIALRRARDEYASAIDGLFDRAGGARRPRGSGVDAAHDRRVMQGLVDLAPPGLDELVAILEVTSLLTGVADGAARPWDLVVIDTAPTGHALRLLEMPALIQDWTRALMRIVLKYQPILGAGNLGQLLLTLSRRIGALRGMLADGEATQFVVVTRAAALPRVETVRLLAALSRLGIHVPAVVVNAVGRGTCAPCRTARAAERREVALLERGLGPGEARPRVVVAPAEVPPPEGSASLRRWSRGWLQTRR
jgi:arsenite-transporting ATPase